MKASRKRRADGRLKSASDSPLSFRESLYSEKAAAMIDSSASTHCQIIFLSTSLMSLQKETPRLQVHRRRRLRKKIRSEESFNLSTSPRRQGERLDAL